MKKIIMIVIAVLAVFVLTGCKDDSLHSKYPGLKPGQKVVIDIKHDGKWDYEHTVTVDEDGTYAESYVAVEPK